MIRALIAARKSTKVEGGQEGASLDTQDQRAREFCERMGWEVVGVARDTISGRVAPLDRKSLGAWIGQSHEWDILVAYRSDRLSRGSDVDWSRIETWAADHGKVLCVVDSSTGIRYPARNDADFWQWTAFKRQAGAEWEAGRERSLRSQADLQALGSYQTRPPYGYRIVGGYRARRLEVIEELRSKVVAVFEMVIDGKSLAEVAAALDLPHDRFVGRMVNNWAYAGRLERNGVHYADCPAIVDAGTLVKAQQSKRSRNRKPTGGRPSPDPALLVPRCSDHDRPMYKTGPKATTYRCPHHFTAPCARVDKAVLAIVFGSTEPERRLVVTPGRDWADEIATARRDRQQALERDDLDAVGELTRLLKDLQARPVEPEQAVWEPTGRTVGEAMAALPKDELRQVLRGWRVKVTQAGMLTVISPWDDAL